MALNRPKEDEAPEPEVITVATLEKIIHISELSTYTAVYNGIAKVMNEKKPEKIDYYVAYEAQVKAGIDLDQVQISVDHEKNEIVITVPEVRITDMIVNPGTLDYMFVNDKANNESVMEEAFKVCKEDVSQESEGHPAIHDMARQNAINLLTALIQPVVDQFEQKYTLTIG